MPIRAALPVVSRRNRGTASVVMLLPTEETTFALNSAKSGRRLLALEPG
jgi:hypothetical protein